MTSAATQPDESKRTAGVPARVIPTSARTFRERAYDVAMAVVEPMAALVERMSKVPTTPILPGDTFSWIPQLEASWREIRREMEAILAFRDDLPAFHEINGDVSDIRNDDWKTFFFRGFGRRTEANCSRCPRTAELIDSIPGVVTAFFSILSPGLRIPRHRGPWKGFVRYHLGLMVPEPAERCGIEVDGQIVHWAEGKSLVFDDTYEHSVWNDTDGTRVVLFLDIERPCRFPGRVVNKLFIRGASLTPFVLDSLRRHQAWERRFLAKQAAASSRQQTSPR